MIRTLTVIACIAVGGCKAPSTVPSEAPPQDSGAVVAQQAADPSCIRYRVVLLVNGETVIQDWETDHWEDRRDIVDTWPLDRQREFVRKFSCENQRIVKVIAP